MAYLVLKGVCKRFGDVAAVDGVSVGLDRGELLALVGPSGCGKTTTLRLVAGFEAPDAGDIVLAGESVLQQPPERRGIGVVFQHHALFPHMDVVTNVGYGLRFSSKGVARHARVSELLELVGLSGLEHRKPDQLSAGQRQRVALARSLAPQPRALLLDEPLSALDVQLRGQLRLEIGRILKEAGTTTLYITHDQEEALALADRVAVMNAGKLEQVGTPQEVYHRPRTPFVANFVGQGNLLAARVNASGAQRLLLQLGSEAISLPAHPNLRPGDAVAVLIRPEQFRLDAGSARLSGTLKDREYLGPTLRLHLDYDGQTIYALCPSHPRTPAALEAGTPLTVYFEPDEVRVMPAEG